MLATKTPYPQYFDTDGLPLDNGSVYYGVVNLDPITNPIPVYWDAAGTISAPQPIKTTNGYPVRVGSPALLYAAGPYSLTVRNQRGVVIYYAADSRQWDNDQVTRDEVTAFKALLLADGGSELIGFDAGESVGDALRRLKSNILPASATTAEFQAAINASIGGTLTLESGGVYAAASTLEINGNLKIQTTGAAPAYIDTAISTGVALDIGANVADVVTTTLTVNVAINQKRITVASSAGIVAGMCIKLRSSKAWYHDARENAGIGPDTDAVGTATAGGSATITLKAGTTFAGFVGMPMTITGGTGKGQSRIVKLYDSGTRVCTMAENWKVAPDATSTYRFPQLFKGETHLVRSVSGNIIELDAQTWDGYDVVDDTYGDKMEYVTVTAWTPLRVSVDNVAVRRPFAVNSNGFGIRMRRCVDGLVSRGGVANALATGVSVQDSYRCSVSGLDIAGCCDTTTGYGIAVTASSFIEVARNYFYNCRRGVDLSGITPSSFCTVRGNVCHGGGAQEDGALYAPQGAVTNSGYGSHGTGRGNVFRHNKAANVSYGIVIRGRDELVQDNEFSGWMKYGVYALHGANLTVKGNTYRPLHTEGSYSVTDPLVNVETNDFTASNILRCQVEAMVAVSSGYYNTPGWTKIEDNDCQSSQLAFIYALGSNSKTLRDYVVKNNVGYFHLPSSTVPCGMVITEGGACNLHNWTETDNDFACGSATDDFRKFGIGVSLNSTQGVVNSASSPRTFSVLVNDDSVADIRIGQAGNYAQVSLVAQNSAAQRFFGLVAANAVHDIGSSTGVQSVATIPTGTSGADGVVSLHYTGQRLFIENRTGASRDFFVTVFPME